jgi:surface carbohydrate biosynthesis protein
MNLYLHVETAARELDSKLLLATVAAARGHTALVADKPSLLLGIQSGLLSPGVFHTKSLTPSQSKLSRHQDLVDRGFVVTSIDEEGGLIDHGYETFARLRYSPETLAQAAAVFAWGPEDADTLRMVYPEHAAKIHASGSPRADLWRSKFQPFWVKPEGAPKRPFLLVASNMGTHLRPFHESIRSEREAGYFKRNPDSCGARFGRVAENYRLLHAFIQGIEHISHHNPGFDIVLRPHPVEDVEAWRVFLDGMPNVHVVREGSITAWVNHAFAVLHNGCTTALEATVAGKPIITYLPFEQAHARELPNELGHRVKTLDELSNAANALFEAATNAQVQPDLPLPACVAQKVLVDENVLAAQKMVAVWEGLNPSKLSHPNHWGRFERHIKLHALKRKVKGVLRDVLGANYPQETVNHKFPPMDEQDICRRVERLQKVLGITEPLECKLLAERVVRITKK